MVEQVAIGLARLRVSIDCLPAPQPAIARVLPAPLVLPLFAMAIPNLIVPCADAASVILAHVVGGDSWSRPRVGVALTAGLKDQKKGPLGSEAGRYGGTMLLSLDIPPIAGRCHCAWGRTETQRHSRLCGGGRWICAGCVLLATRTFPRFTSGHSQTKTHATALPHKTCRSKEAGHTGSRERLLLHGTK